MINLTFASLDVYCDLNSGSQCGYRAKCVYDSGYDHSTCICDVGYIGDGFECEAFKEDIQPGDCTRHSHCLLDEKCVLSPKSGSYSFICVQRDPQGVSGGLQKNDNPVETQVVEQKPSKP